MPSRLSQISVRGSTNNSATVKEVQQHIVDFSSSMNTFLDQSLPLTHDEMLSLGRRIEEECVEKFIQENTKMIEVEKYLCPLSGKKFKGPEYVRKHIHNKHKDKIDEVKLEVQYFNCYLSDRNRPMPKMKKSGDSTFQKNSDKQNDNILALMGSQVFRAKDGAATRWPFNPNVLLPPHGPPFHHGIDYTRFPSYSNFGPKRNQNRKIDDNRKPISYKDWDDPNLDN
ncbi:Serrate RNA effector molecule-like protein isoform X2 [Oopsacas minuta]|uniref:Serrate RNA effector molecule-like protein isoform X2 n=1 Tax=Oopsacas minuta TaxID=111878 RepID=A0AAV7JHH5_9METZ|nr:Serrate RNA effector molecule-like protein isoform X2 [Oopsacas minuta]